MGLRGFTDRRRADVPVAAAAPALRGLHPVPGHLRSTGLNRRRAGGGGDRAGGPERGREGTSAARRRGRVIDGRRHFIKSAPRRTRIKVWRGRDTADGGLPHHCLGFIFLN